MNLVFPHQNTLFGFHRLLKTPTLKSEPIELTFIKPIIEWNISVLLKLLK
ncbi:MAG: hypothetical protein PUP92_20155 [Rhizonema sp. PD38]|nr:hypothetical protein [Rhizonema sp. PD38]